MPRGDEIIAAGIEQIKAARDYWQAHPNEERELIMRCPAALALLATMIRQASGSPQEISDVMCIVALVGAYLALNPPAPPAPTTPIPDAFKKAFGEGGS